MPLATLARALALGGAILGVTCACSGPGGRSFSLSAWLPHHEAPHAAAGAHTGAGAHAAGPHAPGGSAAGHGAAAAKAPGAPASRDMVDAVSNARGSGPVDVRFALRSRPTVGQPAELDLEIIPSQPLARLIASFHAGPGLTLASGGATTQQVHPDAGVPIPHTLTVVARQDGIFYVDATVLADSGTDSIARTFTIPIIAGAGIAAAGAH